MRTAILISAALTLATAAHGADLAVQPKLQPVTEDYWTVTVGGELRYGPKFLGGNSYDFMPYPVFNVRKAGSPEPLLAYRDGLDYAIIDTDTFKMGPVGQFRFGRSTSDDPAALRGLQGVDSSLELGVFGEYWLAPWLRTRLEVRYGFGGENGLIADGSADAIWYITPQLRFFAGPRVTFASKGVNDPYFSVTPVESITSGLPVYSAGGGLRAVGAGGQLRYKWSEAWATHAFVEYDRLQGSAADSPLVRFRGSPDQWVLGVGATYAFNMKAWW
jgi:outer membrane protein